jgi:hypothetical protein
MNNFFFIVKINNLNRMGRWLLCLFARVHECSFCEETQINENPFCVGPTRDPDHFSTVHPSRAVVLPLDLLNLFHSIFLLPLALSFPGIFIVKFSRFPNSLVSATKPWNQWLRLRPRSSSGSLGTPG